MNDQVFPIAVVATQVAPRTKPSNYPEPFASRMAGREKRFLGDLFDLSNFGVNLTIARLGSFAALNSPSWLGKLYQDWQKPLIISAVFALMCIVGAVLYWILEVRADARYELGKENTDKVVFRDIWKFGTSYWFIVALCITFYSGIFPFQTFAVKFFIEAHGATRETAGFLSSMLTLFAMIGTPAFGYVVDRVGRRSLFMMFGALLLIPVYLMMAYKVDLLSPLGISGMFNLNIDWLDMHIAVPAFLMVPVGMMGIAFSLIPGVMWPSVAYIVDDSKLGTAYGLMTMVQNIGLFGFNVLIGWANDMSGGSAANPSGYTLGMWIFSSLGFFAFAFGWLLRRRELGPHGHGLETITAGKK